MKKMGLVLSGGGSKGAYEIGVYKALKRLHKKIDIVTGTSIGAINGMFVAQNNLYGALKFWNHINFETMYKKEEFPPIDDENLSAVYAQYIKAFINEGGIDTTKIREMFPMFFKPYRFFNSDIDYGLITYNFSKRKPLSITKKDMTKENARDYVLSSASCYPAYKPYIIGDELYIDGGYYDNLPINLAIDLGATEIIAVDLRAVGLKKKIKDESIDITYISPRNKIASFLVFDKKRAKEAIKYGYNDTMKTFGKLDGNRLTFRKSHLIKNYNKYNDMYEENLNKIFNGVESKTLSKIFNTSIFKEILGRKTQYKNFNTIVEKAGITFGFTEYEIYNIKTYNNYLVDELLSTEKIDIEIIKEKIKSKKVRNLVDNKQIVKFFYEGIINVDKNIFKYIILFQDEFLIALYIYTIKNNNIN